MKRRFGVYTTDGELSKKKIEDLFLAARFTKIMDSMFWGEETNVLTITEQLDKEHINYAICAI